MLVVHSCTSKSYSGLERYVVDLATWQKDQGNEVLLFCRQSSPMAIEAEKRGVQTWLIPATQTSGVQQWLQGLRVWKQLLKKQPVTLHLHAGGEHKFHFLWMMISRWRPAKVILQYHMWINHFKRDIVHRVLFSGVDEVWVSSQSAKDHLVQRLPIKKEKFRIVPYGREVEMLNNLPKIQMRKVEREKLKLKEQDRVAVTVSRIEPIKGIGELFDAFVQIAIKNTSAHLIIVGDVSPEDENAANFDRALKKKYQALDATLKKRIHFLGYLSDCLPVIAAADFYVLPSYEECMSLAMLDALILGLPILGTNSGGTPFIARPNETGALVPPRDVNQLAKALENFYSNAEQTNRLGEGAKKLGKSFDREKIFQQIWDCYAH